MNYLLDTCVISKLIKTKPNENVIHWIQNNDEDRLFISVLTSGEIEKGIAKLKDSIRKATLKKWMEHDIISRFQGKILDVTPSISRYWGRLP
ncbi:MAG: PIN domain-containing protein [Leptospiraceae bacterium]|nr:PIN domain-containing protein [Leptospiraceae bacterium]MCP5494176.1 PIN domain-containing protein [Leptospiraceae bacterium]